MMRKLQKKNKAFAGKVYFEVYFKPQSGRPLLGGIKFRTYKINLFNLKMLRTRVETRIRQEYSVFNTEHCAFCIFVICFVSLYRREVAAKKVTEESYVKERKKKVVKEKQAQTNAVEEKLPLE